MKKTLSLILALLMSISCASFVAADDAIADENAVAEAPTAYDEAILFLQDNKIMQGYEDGLIHAEKPVERYMMALLNARISTGWTDNTLWEDDIANDSGYTDLAGTVAADYYGAISYADQKGIVEGYPDGSFKPEQQVTYREALAMATRTLGYTGLEWPWGNIEKAVNLGLTEGIEDVAYTTPLNRGQVAQIIYNTLFAKVNGETLAMNIFGIDRAWETILVTADSRSAFVVDGDPTKKAGQVAFQIVNENGTLDSEVYYVNEALEIGHPYRALFNVDEESNLVELVKAVECESTITANVGLTNNEGKAYDDAYPVNTLIGKYDIETKWDLNNVLANSAYDADLILVDAINMQTVKVITGNKYAFDLSTGDIWNIDADAKLVSIKWYYSDILNAYFEKVAVGGEGDEVYKLVSDEDVEALLNDRYYTADKTTNGFTFLTTAPSKSAYSQVEIWDVDGKAYGWYESYRLGEVSAATLDKCYCGEEEDVAGWNFAALNAGSASANAFGKAYVLDSECDDCIGYVVESAIDLANAKYVIYGVNEATKTIKVVKEVEKLTGDVEDLTDMDTYYATGIVRGYRMSKGTVTIGEQNIPYGYDTLMGNTILVDMDDDADGVESRGLYSDWFAGLVNQYVEYVVVDGKIVYIETIGAKTEEWIVVENFIGISSDNYIVVGGYSTSNLKYEMFRIASYDGWKTGDKFWYGVNANVDADFAKGTVYQITSYDATTDTYNVKAIDLEGTAAKITANADGYRFIGDKYYKMTANDKYIIIGADYRYEMPIIVYEGVIPAEWTVTGEIVVGGADKGTIILTDADFDTMHGFYTNAYNFSMAVILDKVVLDWVYDGYGTEYAWYIQGATGYKMEAFDLFTANFVEVYGGYNLDILENRVYPTIDNVIVEDDEISWNNITAHYIEQDPNAATYVIFNDELADVYNFAAEKKDALLNAILCGNAHYDFAATYDVVDDINLYYVTFGANRTVVTDIEPLDAAKHLAGKIGFNATVIYDPDTTDVIIYVYEDTGVVEVKPTTADTEAIVVVQNNEFIDKVAGVDAVIKASANYTTVVEGNVVTGYKINSISYWFDVDATCANLSKYGYNFGLTSHDFRDYTFQYGFGFDAADQTVTLEDLAFTAYECDDCDMIQKITIDVSDANMIYSVNGFDADDNADRHFNFVATNDFVNDSITSRGAVSEYDLFYLDTTFQFVKGAAGLALVDTEFVGEYEGANLDLTDAFNGNTFNLEIAQ